MRKKSVKKMSTMLILLPSWTSFLKKAALQLAIPVTPMATPVSIAPHAGHFFVGKLIQSNAFSITIRAFPRMVTMRTRRLFSRLLIRRSTVEIRVITTVVTVIVIPVIGILRHNCVIIVLLLNGIRDGFQCLNHSINFILSSWC